MALAVLACVLPTAVLGQVVADPNAGARRPTVIQTANGLPQVNIVAPSAAGVSTNAYSQLSVPHAGMILNNSSTIVQTQQAGYINGNPNFAPGQSARIIVNQVTGNLPSSLNGYLEVAGPKAQVILSNANGILVDGGGFINTSRATLTTGTPNFDAGGNVSGFTVTGGMITVQGAGLNAANVDQVDLIARAVTANAAIYANNLNVVTGANQVDYDTLVATPIAGTGTALGVSIDVSQLGGMYANRIVLVGTEQGVGVSLRGVQAAQAGDLTLTTQGQLLLTGQTSAAGNVSLSARDGITNSGTTYAAQSVTVNSGGTIANSGSLAAQQNTTVNGSAIASTGLLGAGVNADGSMAQSGDLTLSAVNSVSANGTNAAGGNASVQGASASLSGSQTSTNGNLTATASAGNLDLTGATTHAGGVLNASAQGSLINDRASTSAQGPLSITAGAVSNQAGQVVSLSTASVQSAGAINNQQGIIQAAGAGRVSGASIDNTAGRIVSLNSDGLSISSTGALTNAVGTTGSGAQGGVIGANGALQLSAGALANHGQINALGDVAVNAQVFDNTSGTTTSGGTLSATVTGELKNTGGSFSGANTNVSSGSIDNGSGSIQGNHLSLAATGDFSNRSGTITQFGTADTTLTAGGALDNTAGTLTLNASNLTLATGSLTNDAGKIAHAGTGVLTVGAQGAASNVGGSIATNGQVILDAASLANAQGTVSALGDSTLTIHGVLDNANGLLHAGGSQAVQAGGAITNQGGTVEAAGTHASLSISGASVDNSTGRIVNVGDGAETVSAQQGLSNAAGGFIGGNGDVALSGQQITNAGSVSASGRAQINGALNNSKGTLIANGALDLQTTSAIQNTQGEIQAGGALTSTSASLDNTAGRLVSLNADGMLITTTGALTNATGTTISGAAGGVIGSNGALQVKAGSLANHGQMSALTDTTVNAQSFDNSSGATSAGGTLSATVSGALTNTQGALSGVEADLSAGSIDNGAGMIQGNHLSLATAGDLSNRQGTISQLGILDTTITAGGSLDNTGGKLASNATNLTVNTASLTNDAGQIAHAGTGALSVAVQGAASSVSGSIATNGNAVFNAESLANARGTISAQGDSVLTVHGALDNSNGLLHAGGSQTVQADGAITNQGGTVEAAGTHASLSVSGASVDNSTGRMANVGDGVMTVSAGQDLSNAAGGFIGGNGGVTLSGQQVTNAGLVSANGDANVAGQFNNSTGTLTASGAIGLQTTGAILNTQGEIQAGGALTSTSASLDNTAGRLVSLNSDGLSITTTGTLTNAAGTTASGAAGGLIGTNGSLRTATGALANHGQISALGDATAYAQSFDNSSGTTTAGGTLTAAVSGAFTNTQGTLSAVEADLSAASIDNGSGSIQGNHLSITTAGNLSNRQGTISQFGNVDTAISAGGAIDNTGGKLASNATNLTVTGASLTNDTGQIAHSGNGTMSVSMQGTVSNVDGSLATNGNVVFTAANLANAQGTISAQSNSALTVQGALDNTNGMLHAGGSQAVQATGTVTNRSGTIEAAGAQSTVSVSGSGVDNTGGRIANAGTGLTTVTAQQAFTNAALGSVRGFVGGNGDVTLSDAQITNSGDVSATGNETLTAQSVNNANGSLVAAGNIGVQIPGAFSNQSGLLSAGGTASVGAASIDNSAGHLEGTQLAVTSRGGLNNSGGTLTQYGTTNQQITVAGTFINTSGTVSSNATYLGITAASLINDHGVIQHAGAGQFSLSAAGADTNIGGRIGTNGALVAQLGSLDNTGGSISAQQTLNVVASSDVANRSGGTLYGNTGASVTTHGQFDNTAGFTESGASLAVQADGAVTNVQGTITANGTSAAHGTLSVSGASVNNTAGRLTNAADGATTISAASIENAAGVLGGNGDVAVNAQSLSNMSGAQVVSSSALNLNVIASVNNSGGLLYGGTALRLIQASVSMANNGGTLLGGLDVSANVAYLNNQGGIIRSNRDISASGAIVGDGEMTAGRNLSLTVAGDYTNGAANHLHADGGLTLAASGNVTNTATLGAGGTLTVSGANVTNTASGDLVGATTNVNAAGTLANDGRIEGDAVNTTSATLANTATIIGNAVQLNATDVQNIGSRAVIAGAQAVNIYAGNSVSNLDGALIYSAGNMQIARDGNRDGTGMLADQVNVLTNRSADIEADGSIDIAAHTVNNSRTSIVTQAGTPQTSTQTLSVWTAGLSMGDLGQYNSETIGPWTWSRDNAPLKAEIVGALSAPITITVPKSSVASLNTGTQTLSFSVAPTDTYTESAGTWDSDEFTPAPQLTRPLTTNPTQYYQSIKDNGSTYSITFWPDWDPAKNIRPDQVRVRYDLGPDSHDYNEISRSAAITTTTDQLLSATAAAKIQAQGTIRINSDGGSINNQSSTMAAGGNLIRRATGGSVNDTGILLQQTTSETDTSTFYWHQKTGNNSDTQVVLYPAVVTAATTVGGLPAIATANGALVTDAQNITVGAVNRLGATVTGNGVTGGNATGTQLGGVTGSAGGVSATGTSGGTSVAGASGSIGATTLSGIPGSSGGVSGTAGGMLVAGASGSIAAASLSATSGVSTLAVHGGSTLSGASGMTLHPQTLGTASGGLPDLALPTNGLYTFHTAPTQTYLVATDSRFTQYTSFVSSDYMLSALNLNPTQVQKRLGDGAYEEQIVRNQVTALTGRTFLAGYSDNMDEYTGLMNNGVTYAKDFNLTPGVGLSDAQMQQLTTDMVWLVSQDVTLPDGTHQSVLVPKLYLAQADTVDLAGSGALVAGNTVDMNAADTVNNSGHIVSDVATTILGNNIVNQGVIGSGGTTTVSAVQDVRNLSGRIGGQDVVVSAGRDVVNETQTIGVSQTMATGGENGGVSSVLSTGVQAVAAISAAGSTTVTAQRDVNVVGATISAGTNTVVAAGRNLNVGTVALTTSQDVQTGDGKNYGHDSITQNLGSTLSAGANLLSISGGNTTITGSIVQAGNSAMLVAAGNLTVTAAVDTHTHSEASLGGPRSQYTKSSYDETVQGSSVQTVGAATLAAGQSSAADSLLTAMSVTPANNPVAAATKGDLAILGSSVTTQTGAANLLASGNVTVGAVTETHDADSWAKTHHSGFLDDEKTLDTSSLHATNSIGSTVSADSVSAVAGKDLTVAGSTIAATNDVGLQAGGNLTIGTTQNTSQSSTYHESSMTGIGASDGLSYGTDAQKVATNDQSTTPVGSLVGSTNGSVNLAAGSTLHITGSDVLAAQNITGTAANVTIDSAVTTQHHDESQESKTSGLTLGATGGLISLAENTSQEAGSASKSEDSRAAALHGMAAARDAYDTGSAIEGSTAAGGTQNGMQGMAVQLSWGNSHSKSTESDNSTTNLGSNLSGGGNVSLTATGRDAQGNPVDGNLNIVGSNVSGTNVALAAANQVNLLASQDTANSHSTNESSSTSLAVSYGTNGWGGSASASKASGNSDNASVTQNNTHIAATDTASIISQGDTNLTGATVTGNTVTANVGGNLNLQSLQDTAQSSAHQQSAGGSVSYSQYGGGSGSFSAQNQNGSSNYASVAEQTGISAGDGGFNIAVKGNTDLKGGIISSTASADQNSLTTGTLTFSDIQNHADYSASTKGISGAMTTGSQSVEKPTGPTSGTNTGSILPALPQNSNGSQDGTTRSAVSDGSIVLTNGTQQTQDLASLSRDTTGTNTVLSKSPDLNNILTNQADMAAATSAAGEAVSKTVGDIATAKEKAADQQLTAAQQAYQADPSDANKAALDAAQTTADGWADNGAYRAALHGAGAALVVGLGGGNALGAAAGTAGSVLASQATGDLAKQLTVQLGITNPDVSAAVTNLVNNVEAGGIGAALGGSSGAVGASNADRYNRQLHPDERKWASDNAKAFAQFYEDKTGQSISVDQAQQMLLANGYIRVDQATASGPGFDSTAAQYITQNAGNLFTATSTEYKSPLLNGTADGSLNPEQRALPGAVANPTVGLVTAGVITGGLAAGPAVVAGAAAAVEACVANPVLCVNQASIGAGEIAAGGAMPAGTGAAVVGTAAAAKEAIILNNYYRDGAPVDLIQQAFAQAATSSTHNAGASEVILGKYIAGSSDSYEAVAQTQGATYFSMSDWSNVQAQLGADKMWSINKAFLDQQMAQGKTFVFTANPANANVGTFTNLEYKYLQDSGYRIVPDKSGFYRATK
ncbi:hemagglutinin repeat-containing protein [Caballeronia sordidicola]|uniref:hemagglutinin repeat-containing protein n=1 Tax=Caballeronia sordidicola TaxID=196367 RepID=UPI00068D0CED|nr:hemagglutinin repeat-containing protein [Caballeronia sordidicola]